MFPIIVRVPKASLFVLYQSGHHGGSAGHGPCEEVGLHGAEAGLPGGAGRLSWGLVGYLWFGNTDTKTFGEG